MSIKKVQRQKEELERKLAELRKAEEDLEKAKEAAKKPIVEKIVNAAQEEGRRLIDRYFDDLEDKSIRKTDLTKAIRAALMALFDLNEETDEPAATSTNRSAKSDAVRQKSPEESANAATAQSSDEGARGGSLFGGIAR